jgi:hypothetical protein
MALPPDVVRDGWVWMKNKPARKIRLRIAKQIRQKVTIVGKPMPSLSDIARIKTEIAKLESDLEISTDSQIKKLSSVGLRS